MKIPATLSVIFLLVLIAGAKANTPGQNADCAEYVNAGETIAPGWERSYRAGCLDPRGRLAGGSELLHLVAHKGKLFAAVGYWEDPRNPWYGGHSPDAGWAQILRLDDPDARWRVDLDMGPRHLRAEILQSATFTTDGSGQRLAQPVSLLLASAYDGGNGQDGISLFTRDDASGAWTKSKIIAGPTGARGENNSVRAMRVYRDKVTGVDRLFVSIGTLGIFSGVYDPSLPGKIKWNPSSETGPLAVRPLAITEANGTLVFSADKAVYRRIDGTDPRYEKIADLGDLYPGTTYSPVGGIRGLTAIPTPRGEGESLLFVWEPGNHARGCVFRLDPKGKGTYERVQEACLDRIVSAYFGGANVPFVLAGYNQILPVTNPATTEVSYLIGMEAWVSGTSLPTVLSKANGGMYAGALYAIRNGPGRYRIAEVNGPASVSKSVLVSTRDYLVSPFSSDAGGAIYFGGYDCNGATCPDRAWVFRTSLENALRGR